MSPIYPGANTHAQGCAGNQWQSHGTWDNEAPSQTAGRPRLIPWRRSSAASTRTSRRREQSRPYAFVNSGRLPTPITKRRAVQLASPESGTLVVRTLGATRSFMPLTMRRIARGFSPPPSPSLHLTEPPQVASSPGVRLMQGREHRLMQRKADGPWTVPSAGNSATRHQCRACGQQGHRTSKCPVARACENCEKSGHSLHQCPLPQTCQLCGTLGHYTWECKDACRHCKGKGHPSDECPNRTCRGCGMLGHMVDNCQAVKDQKDEGSKVCRHCDELGHLARECPNKEPPTCDNCSEVGHVKSQCPKCHNCKQDGHSSKGARPSKIKKNIKARRPADTATSLDTSPGNERTVDRTITLVADVLGGE